MKSFLLLFFILSSFYSVFAQEGQRLNYDQAGISFVIPAGWQAQDYNQGLLLQHPSIPGLIYLTVHSNNKAQLMQEAYNGLNENGNVLRLTSELTELSATAFAGDYEGILEGNYAKAYLIFMENPHKGQGIKIISAATTQVFSSQLKQSASELYSSFEFKPIAASNVLDQWTAFLAGNKLSYFERSSSGGLGGGISGGYSVHRTIDLCPQGHFNYGNTTDMAMDGVDFGTQGNVRRGSGTWEIVLGNTGAPTLKLNFHNGEQSFFQLKYEEEKLYLNGNRYFKTSDGEYAPSCQ